MPRGAGQRPRSGAVHLPGLVAERPPPSISSTRSLIAIQCCRNCHGDDGRRPTGRYDADRRMEEETAQWQEGQSPRHVEERCRACTRQKRAHLVEIAQRLLGENWFCPCATAGRQVQGESGIAIQHRTGRRSAPAYGRGVRRNNLAASKLYHYRREPEQRCNVAARDYAIVNLQHVKRAGQREQVDHSAKYRHAR